MIAPTSSQLLRARRTGTTLRFKGYGLLEIALGIAIAALLIAGAMMYFQNANYERRNKELVEMVSAVVAAVHQTHAGQPDYNGISADILARGHILPAKYKAPPSLKTPFNTRVTVSPVNSGTRFELRLYNLPKEACVALLTRTIGAYNAYVYRVEILDPSKININTVQGLCSRTVPGADDYVALRYR